MASFNDPSAIVKPKSGVKVKPLYTCVKCLDILKAPVFQLTNCGHRICGPCNKKICSECVKSPIKCPGGSPECTKVDITNEHDKFEDNSLNDMLTKLLQNKDSESQVDLCTDKIGDSNDQECNQKLPIQNLTNPQLEYGKNNNKCFVCKQSVSEIDMVNHNCLEDLLEKFNALLRTVSTNTTTIQRFRAENNIISSLLMDLSMENISLTQNLRAVEEMINTEETNRKKIQDIIDMMNKIENIKAKLKSNYSKITNLELRRQPITLQKLKSNGKYETFVMKIHISNFSSDGCNIIESDSFYIPNHGYRLCLTVLPYEDLNEKWWFVLVTLLKGDYDAIQTWPCNAKITLTLVSRKGYTSGGPCTGDHNIGEICTHQENGDVQETFNVDIPQPTLGPEVCYDNPLVVSDTQLQSGRFTTEDHVYIKANVEIHNEPSPGCGDASVLGFPQTGECDCRTIDQ